MELLLALLAELLAILAIASGLVVALVAALLIAALILALAGRRPPPAALRRWLRRIALVIVALVAAAFVLLQTIAAPTLLRWLLAEVAAAHGTTITFDDAELSLLRGALRLRGVTLRRGDDVALTGDRLVIDVDWPSLLVGAPIRVEKLDLHGVRGRVHHRRGGPRPALAPTILGHLTLSEIDLAFANEGGGDHRLQIKELSVAPLRSDHAIFDLLVATSGRVQVDQVHLEIRRQPGLTTWSILAVPTALLGVELPPALRALATVELDLELELELGEPIGEAALLRLTVRVAGAPRPAPGPGSGARHLVTAVQHLARAAGLDEATLEVTLDADALRGQRSLSDGALPEILRGALLRALQCPRAR